MRQLKRCLNQIGFLNICQFSFQIVLKIKQGYNRHISELIIFIFRSKTIFWDIPKWNRGQTNQDGGNITFKHCNTKPRKQINKKRSLSPRLTHPSPLYSVQVFPTPQRWWIMDGARFQPRTMGRGWVQTFQTHPASPLPVSTLPRFVKSYNCKFFIP